MRDVGLNAEQRHAVEHPAAPLLVLAGAGSGKTRVLTSRLAYHVEVGGVAPNRIFAVTFTNRAANEMRRRVAEMLGYEPSGMWVGTFHSLAARMLRREAPRLGFTHQYSIYDEVDRLRLIKRLLEQGGYSPKSVSAKAVQSLVSAAKNRLETPEEFGASASDRTERAAAFVYQAMGEALRAANAMDFDDLLMHPLRLFREHPDRLAYYQGRWDCILVDEFQDTNRAQYLLVRSLAERHRNICVVGDDDQSIYSWRGAEVRNMLDFQRDFANAELIRLERNYRSTQVILDAANGVIAENAARLGKTLFTERRGGQAVVVTSAADERDEADWVVRELRKLAEGSGPGYEHAAVLYRTNAQSRAFEECLRREGIPYRIVGAVSFYDRREVKDLVAYLRLLVNPADDEAFFRVVNTPKRGIGMASLRTVADAAAQWGRSMLETATIADRVPDLRPQAKRALTEFGALIAGLRARADGTSPAAVLEHLIEAVGYMEVLAAEGPDGIDRLENVRELVAAAADWSEEVADDDEPGTPLERFLQQAALTTSADQSRGTQEGVTLMTVHTAKGLEWPVTVVAGMEDGLFPLSRAFETPEGLEEERRLAYVAITRAKDQLMITWARSRRRGGQLLPGRASRFLDALPPGVVEERRTSSVFDVPRTAPAVAGPKSWFTDVGWDAAEESQVAPRYVKGERVQHRTFGSGTIRGVAGQGRDLKVSVEFDDESVGVKQLLVAYAGLERAWDGA
jgi:DNA helicase-2/ATP-dependent DNA helicase PcrA